MAEVFYEGEPLPTEAPPQTEAPPPTKEAPTAPKAAEEEESEESIENAPLTIVLDEEEVGLPLFFGRQPHTTLLWYFFFL